MKQAKISDLKNNLSRYLDLVRRGETIQVLDRDVPVAEIRSVRQSAGKTHNSRLLDLERKGIVRCGDTKRLRKLIARPLTGKNAGVLDALLREREEEL